MGAFKNHFHALLTQRDNETRVRKLCATIYLQSLEDFGGCSELSYRWLINATRLWNWIDHQDFPAAEHYWQIMTDMLPEAFLVKGDADSILFTYH
tara:strand:+ start:362 stop:646 length:285 start_codon:yes stop_codon:yes gene_type:complete